MLNDAQGFLARPGLCGPCGALMDEYARAAHDFCQALESLAPARFDRTVESEDEAGRSLRALAVHTILAALGYANYIRKARGLPVPDRVRLEADKLGSPRAVRPLLVEALRYTEGALDGLYEAGPEALSLISFQVRWGPSYDAEMLLEHAIVHLLRHRRQIERWPV